MANPILGDLVAAVTRAQGVMDSATALINGFAAKLDAAIAQALANGATEAELLPLQNLDDELHAKSDALAQAVAANP